jgi:hypothetical protein
MPWVQKFKEHPKYQGKRLKVLPKFDRYLELVNVEGVDVVDKATFGKYEPDRLPLFKGTSLGIMPGIRSIDFDADKEIAIVGKSPFSGKIFGMTIYQVKAEDQRIRIVEERMRAYFSNKRLDNTSYQ